MCTYLHSFLLKDLYCLSWISLNSVTFTIRRQLVDGKPEPTLLSTQAICNLPHHIYMAFDGTGLLWHCKLYTVVEIQNNREDGIGNRTTDLQIRSLTSEKKSDTLTTWQLQVDSYKFTHAHTHAHTHNACTHSRTHAQDEAHASVHKYTRTLLTYAHSRAHTCTDSRLDALTHYCRQMYTHSQKHTSNLTYILTHTYTYGQTLTHIQMRPTRHEALLRHLWLIVGVLRPGNI